MGLFTLQQPDQLPTFADVGGMSSLKELLTDTFGLLLAFSGQADQYRITFNGILLHGPPGVGKSFIARATAGEFGLNFVRIITGDLISKWVGESAKNVAAAFRFAAANVPCVLFFDEFDSVAVRRDDQPDNESRRVVNQLLSSLEEYRGIRELVVMAATNRLDSLDPAVTRPGRFDKHVRVDLPDRDARRAVLTAQLHNRPTADNLDTDGIVDRTEGLTPAALKAIVDAAALAAFRESAHTNRRVPITTERLLGALIARGGTDRPTPSAHGWDDLVLDTRTKHELQQIQRLIEDPEIARRFGIDPPSGLLLAGPPGTGKTTIARVLAAQARCSFYSVSAADLTSKWVGESEQRVQTLFARARDNAPSIVFLDELDAIARKRTADQEVADRQLTQLLAEIDGLGSRPGVFVVGATNRPDMIDQALTRGGRLSRTIVVPLPDVDARVSVLKLLTQRMPLHDVDLSSVARVTEGFSGGDLKAVCQQAAINALMRTSTRESPQGGRSAEEVRLDDFASAVAAIKTSKKMAAATATPFCIAVFAILATTVTSTVLDQLESRLATEAASPIRRTERGSVARYEFEFPLPQSAGKTRVPARSMTAPVALTVYKRYARVRIQVLTHDLHRAQAQALQQRIAALAGLQIVEWSSPETEQHIHQALTAVQAEAAGPAISPGTAQERRWQQR